MEGMLSPDFKEEITGTSEVRETFKISKIGTIAGCMVLDGSLNRNTGVLIINAFKFNQRAHFFTRTYVRIN